MINNPQVLSYASGFNYQKVVTEGSLTITTAVIHTRTVLGSVATGLSTNTSLRTFCEFNSKMEELSYISQIGLTSALLTYIVGSTLFVATDDTSSIQTFTLHYKVYLDG